MIRKRRFWLGGGLLALVVCPAFAGNVPLQLPSAETTPAAAASGPSASSPPATSSSTAASSPTATSSPAISTDGTTVAPAAAAIANSAVPPTIATVDAATAIKRANAYFDKTTTLVANFVQIGPDGRRSGGKLYVQKPGRLRFEYAPPATLEIIADGTSVAVRDRKLATQDLYFIWQTPLKFLLKRKIDLARDTKVLNVSSNPVTTSITVKDTATLGGTSHIRLVFDTATFALERWTVIDPQGYETNVSLFNVNTTTKPNPSLFHINYQTDRDDDNPYQ